MNHIETMKQALDALENSAPKYKAGHDSYADIAHMDAISALRAAIAQPDSNDDLTIAYMAGAASRSEETARLQEIGSEWMRLSQDEGKAERLIERLTAERDDLRMKLYESKHCQCGYEDVCEFAREAEALRAELGDLPKAQADMLLKIKSQRNVIEQALKALNLPSMKTEAMLEQRDQAIAAIQELLK